MAEYVTSPIWRGEIARKEKVKWLSASRKECRPRNSSSLMVVIYFQVTVADHSTLLLYYLAILYISEAMDNLMLAHGCSHMLIVGDLNHLLERKTY